KAAIFSPRRYQAARRKCPHGWAGWPWFRACSRTIVERLMACAFLTEQTMTNTALIRPAWTPATIALMVLGFFLFWPLGFAMLAYILWGDRLEGFKRGVNEKTDSMFGSFRNCRKGESFNCGGTTGNEAFDEWRRAELERLAEERRKLEEARAEFET